MSFDNQKKILSKNNPIDFIEEYVLNYEIEKVRDSRDEIIIFSKGVWRNYEISFKWDSKRKIIEIITYFEISKKNRINKSIYSLIIAQSLILSSLVIKFQLKVKILFQ